MTRAGSVSFEFDEQAAEEAIAGLGAAGRVAYTADYAEYVNYPTAFAGSQPPFDPLREWVDRKWPDLDGGLKDAALAEGMEANSGAHKAAVTWIVIHAIAENGTEGVFFAERSLEEGKRKADALAAKYEGSDDPEAGRKLVEDALDLMFARSQDIVSDEASDTGNLLQSGIVELLDADDVDVHETTRGGEE
jgi:hypothetical protein